MGMAEMFELETIMKAVGTDVDDDYDVTLSAGSAREIIEEFSTLKTALRRIRSMDDKNIGKYAKEIASQALAMPTPRT